MGETLMDKLLDFDQARLRIQDCVVTWKALAGELGVSEDSLQNWCKKLRVVLPRWGPRGRKSPVFLPRGKIMILKSLYFA